MIVISNSLPDRNEQKIAKLVVVDVDAITVRNKQVEMGLAQAASRCVLAIFDNKLERDDRQAVFTFSIPAGQNGEPLLLGLLAPSLSFWFQLTVLLLIQSVVCVILACFIYRFIIQQRNTVLSFLVGYGIVLPSVLAMPWVVTDLLDLQNMSLIMSVASTPTLVFFRCLEAMYGTSPAAVEEDMLTYCLYYCAVIQFRFDPNTKQPIPATPNEIWTKGLTALRSYFLIGCFYSAVASFSYLPFPTSILTTSSSEGSSLWDLFHWGHICNNFFLACTCCNVMYFRLLLLM